MTGAESIEIGGARHARAPFAGAAAPAGGGVEPGVFRSVMGRAMEGATKEQEARAGAEELVAIALIQPVLAGLRESSQAAEPFAPGPYEKQFGGFVDAEIARRMVKAQNFPLVERVARDLLRMGKTTEGTPDDEQRNQSAAQSRRL